MEYEKYVNSDILKLYYSLLSGNGMVERFKDPMYAELLKIARKDIPAGLIGKGIYDTWYRDDDFCVDSISYGQDAAVWFDDIVIEEVDPDEFEYPDDYEYECEYKYSDRKANPVSIDIRKPGTEIISPEIVIGKPLVCDTVFDILDGNISGSIGSVDLGGGTSVISCRMSEFDLELVLRNGILERAELLAIFRTSQPESD